MVDCVVIGDIMFDVFFQYEEKHTAFSRRGTSYSSFAKIDFGGAGNVASALSLLGSKVFFIGKAGDDFWGKLYEANLTSQSVTTNIFLRSESRQGSLWSLAKRIVRGRSSCSEELTISS